MDIQTLLLTLFGGLNIVQLLSYNHLRRKIKADEDIQSIEATKQECLLHNNQYDYLIGKLQYFQAEHFKLLDKVNQDTEGYIKRIESLNIEIYQVRAEVKKYKLQSCSRTGCQQRIQ